MDGGGALIESYPAVPESVPRARSDLTMLAIRAGAGEGQIDAIRLAASEALTNAVLHAYDGMPGEIHLTAAVTGDELWLLIADDGHGLDARTSSPGLGMGLALIACSADYFAVVKRTGGGTEIQMRFEIGGGNGSRRGHSRGSALSASAPA
jgi:anti-sigma regulatory factor (Ser/Thr protein kinase)